MASDSSEETLSNFPNPFANKKDKKDKNYGLRYANAIWAAHRKTNVGFTDTINILITNRKYAEGLENIDKYKERLALDGDTSWLNLDFAPVNRIAHLVDIIEGKLMDQLFKIQCNPIDVSAKIQEDEDRDKMYAEMFLKKHAAPIEQLTGIPIYPKNKKIPETDQEAELFFKLNYKQAASIAMEQLLQFVFMNNDFDTITRKKILRDLIVIKRAAIQRYYDADKNIKVRYVDPLDLITPYSKYDDFRNIPYQALREQITIGEIAQMTDEFDEETLAKIAEQYAGTNGNPQWNTNFGTSYEGYYISNTVTRHYYNFNVPVLNFWFLTNCKENRVKTKKPNGRTYFDNAKDNAKPVSENKELISKDIQYRFEGMWIIGSEYVFNYKETENHERDKISGSYSPKTELPIAIIAPNIYDMQNKSLVERAIPHEDQLNLINLKIQQLLIMAKPPGHWIDQDALSGVMLGQGEAAAKPVEIYRMFAQTGSVLGRSTREDGSIINGDPIRELANGIGEDFPVLITAYRSEMDKINDVLGYNNEPKQNAPVGTSEIIASVATDALRGLYTAHVWLIEKTAKGCSIMIQDSINYNNEAFTRAVGGQAVEALKYGKKLALNEFGIKIELLPDDSEQAELRQQIALGQQSNPPLLYPSDVLLIQSEMKQDVKKAAQLLVMLEDKNKAAYSAEASKRSQEQAQFSAQASQVAEQAKMQSELMINKSKGEYLKLEFSLKSELSKQEHIQAMEQIAGKNAGLETTAQINAGKSVQVQSISTQGKLEESHVAAENKIQVKHIEHQGKLVHTAYENALEPKDTDKDGN